MARHAWCSAGLRALLAAAALLGCAVAFAAPMEGVLEPGQVIRGHEKAEQDCNNCHMRFNRGAQDSLCMKCHEDVEADLKAKKSYHGRMKSQACSVCHTDHKGRDANIMPLDDKTFDHNVTDFRLHGGHLKPKCEDCHDVKVSDVKKRYRSAPIACFGCHKKDDKHKGQFSEKCEPCHSDNKWKEILFDHDRDTKYPLRGKHVTTKCEDCHTGNLYTQKLQSECIACHKKDDKHKGAEGDKCGDCHTEKDWKEEKFDHDKTRFPLRGKHEKIECKACHKTLNFKEAPLDCLSCHKKDDKHKGQFGIKCGDCHNDRVWKDIIFNHDRDTKYPLRGKHITTKCEDCHTGNLYTDKLKSDCVACHKKDDKHKGTLGPKCGDCHTERDWKVLFDHDKTRFPLRPKHDKVACKDCHKSPVFKDAPMDCFSCHKKDDKHKGLFGIKCEDCHVELDWKKITFDHDRDTKYPLRGKHKTTKCEDCHKGNLYTDKLKTECIACHKKDDKHEGQEGNRCESCHVEDDWKKVVRFDHGLTRFPLLGKHEKLKCEECHKSLRYKDAKIDCVSCHDKDDAKVHKRRLGTECGLCHSARDWKHWVFDHNKTKFKLDGGHANLDCYACHKKPAEKRATLPLGCDSCHDSDDVHAGRFGRLCEQCHVTSKWKTIKPGATGGRPVTLLPVPPEEDGPGRLRRFLALAGRPGPAWWAP